MLATWEKTQNKQAREQVHLHVKTGRFVKKKQGHFQPRPYPKARALSAKLQKWSSEFFTHSGSEERVSSSKTSHFSETIPKLTE